VGYLVLLVALVLRGRLVLLVQPVQVDLPEYWELQVVLDKLGLQAQLVWPAYWDQPDSRVELEQLDRQVVTEHVALVDLLELKALQVQQVSLVPLALPDSQEPRVRLG